MGLKDYVVYQDDLDLLLSPVKFFRLIIYTKFLRYEITLDISISCCKSQKMQSLASGTLAKYFATCLQHAIRVSDM